MNAKDKVTDARPGVFWMNDAVFDSFGAELGVYGIAVYAYLCRRANANAQCWPSLNGTAKMLKLSRSKVVTTLDTLEKLGFISRMRDYDKKGGYSSTVYTLHDVATLVREKDKGSPHGGQPLVRGAVPKEVTIEGSHIKGLKEKTTKEKEVERRSEDFEWFFQ